METIVLPNYSWGTLINRPDINCISSWTDQIWSDVNNLLNNCDVVVFNQVCSHGRAPLSASDSFVENLVALKAYFLFIVEDEKSVRRDFSDEKDIFQRLRYLYSISEFQRLDTLLQTLAIQIQQSVLKGDMDVVEQFVNVYIETKVFEMVYGNVLQCTRKYFGYVLPEKKLVRWFCLQFQNCPRVISLGAGTCFFELAMQIFFIQNNIPSQLVCVENGHHGLGLENEETKAKGFVMSPMRLVYDSIENFQSKDGVFIAWGRNTHVDGDINIWLNAEHSIISQSLVNVVCIIGASSKNNSMGFFAYDLFGGVPFLEGKEWSAPVEDTQTSPESMPRWVGRRSTEFGEDSADVVRFVGWFGFDDRASVWTRVPGSRVASSAEADIIRTDHMFRGAGDVIYNELPGFCWGVLVKTPNLHEMDRWTPADWKNFHWIFDNWDFVVFDCACNHTLTSLDVSLLASMTFDQRVISLRDHLRCIVAAERAALAAHDDNRDAIFQDLHYFYSRTEFDRNNALMCSLAVQVQEEVDSGNFAAVQKVVSVVLESECNLMVYGNLFQAIRKYFGFVLPTPRLVSWFCDQYADCKRVISIGAGTGFFELAMQIQFRQSGRTTQLICVDNGVDGLDRGIGQEGKYTGFCLAPTRLMRFLPRFVNGDGVFISWGRNTGGIDNIWIATERQVIRGTEVNTVGIIGSGAANNTMGFFPCDTFGGFNLAGGRMSKRTKLDSLWQGTRSTDFGPNSADVTRFVGMFNYQDRAVIWKRVIQTDGKAGETSQQA